jgi:TRAP-type C4-dicarboxylate transport system permease large subunit
MVIILAMGVGLFALPFGVGYHAACAISRVHPDEGLKPIVGHMIALLIGLLLFAFVPWSRSGFSRTRRHAVSR